ncbi:MAG: hypothetical protein PHU31_09060, partial [Anaerotignum sp.]|nr:hypothetical protein [Anaerotignum sp.]
ATGLAHDGTEMVVFQLMKGDLPAGIITVKRDIQTDQQVQAYFDVEGTGYSVKVFVFDRLSYESGNTQVNLAEPILLQ